MSKNRCGDKTGPRTNGRTERVKEVKEKVWMIKVGPFPPTMRGPFGNEGV